jgi:hypothetical protein
MAYADADLDGSGRASYIVAAFSNGFSGAVAVLARQGTSAFQVAAPRFPLMMGIQPHVRLLDVDRDGRPEVIVSFSSAKGLNAEWVLRWKGGTLEPMGPGDADADGDATTLLHDALFIDLDGDGTLEIVNTPDESPDNDAVEYEVYALAGGRYTETQTLVFFDTFARPAKSAMATTGRDDPNGQPDVITTDFVVADPTRKYEMRIVNGDDAGGHRVTSGDIRVNGVRVAVSEVFGGKRRVVIVPIAVAASNTIRATLRGPRGAWLTVAINPVDGGK